jgi:hypothetical protein
MSMELNMIEAFLSLGVFFIGVRNGDAWCLHDIEKRARKEIKRIEKDVD